MLVPPVAIVALVLYLIVGPLTVSQRFQTRFKSLSHGVRRKISSVLSLPRATFEPQDYPVAFEATTTEALPIIPVETSLIHPVETIPASPVPLEDYVETVIQGVYPTRYDDHPSPASVRMFVVSSECQGPFDLRDLLNYRVLEVLTAIYFSILFPFVVIPFVAKLLLRSESRDEAERPIDASPELLPPKFLAPPTTAQIRILDPKSHVPLEPIFSPAPPEPSTFWFAPEKTQDQPSPPSPPLLRLLHLSPLKNDSQNRLSPLISPADSGYETTLPDTASDASSLVSGDGTITTPGHLTASLLIANTESILVHDSNSVTTTPDNFTGEKTDAIGFDTELGDDDDDGSITVTNSTANLADLIICPAPVSAEVLTAKLECIAATLIEEVKSLPEPPAEEPPVIIAPSEDSTADLPFHTEPSMDLPSSDYEPVSEFGIATQESAVEDIPVDVCVPSEPSSDATGTIVDPVCVDERGATSTYLKEGEIQVEVDLPPQDDLDQDVEPWTPDYEVPVIIISPPSEVDPEDEREELENTVGLDFEDESGESGYDDESELEYADNYPDSPVAEVILELPPSPVEVRDDPYHSPITTTGKLWADDESNDPGPLPLFESIAHTEVYDNLESPTLETSDAAQIAELSEAIDAAEQIEVQRSPVEEETSNTASAASDDLNTEVPVAEATQQPVEEPQLAPEVPAQRIVEPAPAEPVPSTSPSSSPQNLPHASRSKRNRTQAPSDNRNRGEGSSRNGKTLENSRLQYFHCCNLSKPNGRPKSWENWKIEKPVDCIPKRTSLQEWQFVRPTDKDGENPTTRIVIENLDADRFRTVDGVLSYNYLTEAMGSFSTKSYRCWRGRKIGGVEYSYIGHATVDLDSVGEAIRMFDELQGRRLKGHTWHWRLEFVDPSDETHGGRRTIHAELVPDSVKQALAAELEASTRTRGGPGHSDGSTAGITRPPAKVRPQVSIGGRTLFTGAMSNVVQDRRTRERAAQSTRVSSRRPYRS